MPLFVIQYLTVIVGFISYMIPYLSNLGVHNTTVPACQAFNRSGLGDACEFTLTNLSYDTVRSLVDGSRGVLVY